MTKSQSRSAVWASASIVFAISALALVGWLFDFPLLKSVRRDWISMRVMTALSLAACAAALLLVHRARAICRILGLLVALTGVVSLCAYAWPFISLPARMAPITAVAFIALGSAFVALASPGPRAAGLGHALALVAAFLSYLVLISYVLDVSSLHTWLGVGMAFNTALAFCALLSGVFLVRPDTWWMAVLSGAGSGAMIARRLLPAVLLVPLFIGGLHLIAERASLFPPAVGTAITAAANAFVLLWVTWLVARSANRIDQRRWQTEAALQQRREWLRVTLTSIGDAVLAADPQGHITFLNPVAAALTGWTEEEALGRPAGEVFRIINEQTHQPEENIIARALREGAVISLANHTALVARDGREIPIEDSAAPIRDSAGHLSGVVLVFHDVTEKRRAQQELRESERRVRLKLDSILSPEGDIGNLELGDILDLPAIQSLMDDFYRLTRIPTAIIDLKGKVLAGVGWQPICTRFHRANPQTCRHCIESDTQLTAGIAAGEFRLYKCKNGMWDVATPLLIGGQHFGNLFSGQFFFAGEPVDEEFFRTQARLYGFHESEYLAALAAVPRLERAVVETAVAFLIKLGQALSLLSYSNVKLARSLAERDTLTDRLSRAQQIGHLGSWELDLVRNRLTWSDEVYRIFGLRPQEFAATYEAFLEAVHPADRAAVDAAYSGSLREGKDSYEITHRVVRKATGEIRWVHEKCEHVRDDAGRIVRSIGMVQDITERKRVEEHMRDAQKLESIGLLAGGIAHDFNNLLVGVIGNASLAEDMLPAVSPAREMLRRITRCGEQAAHLTRQMLAYAGKGRFIVEPIRLGSVVRDTVPLLESSISKKIAVELQLDPATPIIESDLSQMQQVFMNLAINAGEAIGDRSGVVSVSTGETTVAAAQIEDELEGWPIEPGQYAFLEVRDTGCGMNPETQAKIFDPFFTTKFQGRGLGLAAVAGIIRAHKGAVRVTTAPGAGSAFRVLFPVAAVQAPAGPPAPDIERDLRGQGTVLVVDDEPVVRDLARQSLQRMGYEVLLAENGPQAIERIRSDGNRIRLVVLDLSMPGMSGQEILPHLRQLRPDLDVLVSSGYSEAETLRLFQGARLSGFIQKPYTVQDLAREVKAVLDRRLGTPINVRRE